MIIIIIVQKPLFIYIRNIQHIRISEILRNPILAVLVFGSIIRDSSSDRQPLHECQSV